MFSSGQQRAILERHWSYVWLRGSPPLLKSDIGHRTLESQMGAGTEKATIAAKSSYVLLSKGLPTPEVVRFGRLVVPAQEWPTSNRPNSFLLPLSAAGIPLPTNRYLEGPFMVGTERATIAAKWSYVWVSQGGGSLAAQEALRFNRWVWPPQHPQLVENNRSFLWNQQVISASSAEIAGPTRQWTVQPENPVQRDVVHNLTVVTTQPLLTDLQHRQWVWGPPEPSLVDVNRSFLWRQREQVQDFPSTLVSLVQGPQEPSFADIDRTFLLPTPPSVLPPSVDQPERQWIWEQEQPHWPGSDAFLGLQVQISAGIPINLLVVEVLVSDSEDTQLQASDDKDTEVLIQDQEDSPLVSTVWPVRE